MAIQRKHLFGKLNKTLYSALESAVSLCKLRGNCNVELVHWINQLWFGENNDFRYIVTFFQLDIKAVERGLSTSLTELPSGAQSINDFSWDIELAIEKAWMCASLEYMQHSIRSGHLIFVMLSHSELRRSLLKIVPVLGSINLEMLQTRLIEIIEGSDEDVSIEDDEALKRRVNVGQPLGKSENDALTKYTTDLTDLARQGKIDPVLGRESEIASMADILLRRRQNNPLLTGEAGVGKTAVVEGLAQAIASGAVPPALREVRLLSLDVMALSAGASMKGEFEARLKVVLDEAIGSEQPVVLFIDEVHTLVGAGGNTGTGDAANLLKPVLARGQLRTIGATTWSEFKRHIEKDPALTRRFQVLQIDEPDASCAIAMLRSLIPSLEKHHGVWIMDEAAQAAVSLSQRYIPARQLPDKAISLLDTACARVAIAQFAPPAQLKMLQWQYQSIQTELSLLEKAGKFGKNQSGRIVQINDELLKLEKEIADLTGRWRAEQHVTEAIIALRQKIIECSSNDAGEAADRLRQQLVVEENRLSHLRQEEHLVHAEVNEEVIASIVGDWTAIPVGQMLKDDVQKVMTLPQRLSQRIIGQERALIQLSESIMTGRAGLADPCKPLGVFMLVGPSGVGKTETALAIADSLYGGKQNLITLNMSEFQEPHTISSLKGSPPGYVGYGNGGVLTEAVRKKPYSVVLLDEIEKAHPDVHELFYQVFDKGQMEDGEGRQIDFKNTILLLTSNIGSEMLMEHCNPSEEHPENQVIVNKLKPELLNVFPPAFLGRVTVVPYFPLQTDSLKRIIKLCFEQISQRLVTQHQALFVYSSAVVQKVLDQCGVSDAGGRAVIRYIEQTIMPLLSKTILQHKKEICGQTLKLNFSSGSYVVKVVK
ncbi:type VI secretion system ATPase TssH [Rosenbergiella epipactidis]|uniref:type VI secretion system ATPase TssH n=1 Tax=Rosenbergiella epipactidis TaxID=1544694 RepID=UPI001F500ABC